LGAMAQKANTPVGQNYKPSGAATLSEQTILNRLDQAVQKTP